MQGCFLLNSTSSVNKAMCQHFGTQTKVIIFWKYNFHAVKVSGLLFADTSVLPPRLTVLHQSTTPPILCRDAKLGAISSFLRNSITKQQPGALYICGAPGTGKTACLTHIGKLGGMTISLLVYYYNRFASCSPLLASGVKKPPMLK